MTGPVPTIAPFDSAWRRRVEVCERFEEAWQTATPPNIAAFAADAAGDERRRLLLELLRIDLEYRLRTDDAWRVEAYYVDLPELLTPPGPPAELVVDELLLRRERDEAASTSEWRQRFPGREEELRAELSKRTSSGSELQAEPSQETRQLGRYRLLEVLGRGGFAVVYRAIDVDLRREVALKVPHGPAAAVAFDDRFEREARSAARLRHPAIVPIHEVGRDGQTPYLVYELLPGPTLAEFLRQEQPTPWTAAQWVERLAQALDYAHGVGVIHRDVKPANILFDSDNLPTLADFGLARDIESGATLTQHGDILGTPAYMSPEQAAGRGHDADGRTDVYSLGIVLYELLCGRTPFPGGGIDVLRQVIHDEPARPSLLRSNLPLDLETICLKAIAKEPRDRYRTAGDLASDLRAFLENRPISARRSSAIDRTWRWCRRNPPLAATLAVASSAIFLLAVFSYLRVAQERDRYQRERETAVAHLYESLEREARAIRLARRTGYREVAHERLQAAGRLDTPARIPAALRQEALASLGDFVGRSPAVRFRPQEFQGWLSAVAFHPASDLLAIAYTDVVVLHEVRTHAAVQALRAHDGGVYALAFAPDGRSLISMDDQGRIVVHRRGAADSEWTVVARATTEPSAERDAVVAVSCFASPDGRTIYACAKGEARVGSWDLETGRFAGEFRGEQGELFVRATLSPDGRTLVGAYRAADLDGIVVWDVPSRKVRHKAAVSSQGIVDATFSHDGATLACACLEGVYVLDAAAWERRTVVRADAQFYTVAFHPRRPLLAIPSRIEGRVRLWDVESNREVAHLDFPGQPHSVAFSPDGRWLTAGDEHRVCHWDLIGAQEKLVANGHRGVVNDVRFSPDGRVLATAGADTKVILWNPESLEPLGRAPDRGSLLAKAHRLAFDATSRRLAVVDWNAGAAIYDVTQTAAPLLQRTLLSPADPQLGNVLFDVQFDPAGNQVAVAGAAGVRVWDESSEGRTLSRESTVALRYCGDGNCLVVRRHAQGRLQRIDVRSGATASISADVHSLGSFVPIDSHLLTCEGRLPTGAPRFRWTPLDTTQVRELECEGAIGALRDASLTPDFALANKAARAAVKGKNVAVWDLQDGRLLYLLPSEGAAVSSLDISSDGQRVVCGLSDGGIVLWNLREVDRQLADFPRER